MKESSSYFGWKQDFFSLNKFSHWMKFTVLCRRYKKKNMINFLLINASSKQAFNRIIQQLIKEVIYIIIHKTLCFQKNPLKCMRYSYILITFTVLNPKVSPPPPIPAYLRNRRLYCSIKWLDETVLDKYWQTGTWFKKRTKQESGERNQRGDTERCSHISTTDITQEKREKSRGSSFVLCFDTVPVAPFRVTRSCTEKEQTQEASGVDHTIRKTWIKNK